MASALEKEVGDFINNHKQRCDEKGHRIVVGNGYRTDMTIQTELALIAIK